MKKIAALILSVVILYSMPIVSFAQENARTIAAATRLVTSGTKTPSYQWANGQSYFIGNVIPTYVLENGQLTSSSNMVYYPIYQNERITGILTEISPNSPTPSHTFSPSFAAKLNQITNSGNSNYILVVSGRQVFVFCKDIAIEVAAYDVPLPDGTVDCTALEVQSAASSANLPFAAAYSRSNKQKLAIPNINTRSPDVLFRLLNVKDVTAQASDSNRCWAATMWCIGEFMTEGSLFDSYEAFALSVGVPIKHTQTLNEAIAHIRLRYGVNMRNTASIFSPAQIEAQIDADRPMSMVWVTEDSRQIGHMTTGCGYAQDSTTFEIGIMDSLEGDLLWVERGESNWYRQPMGNLTYYYCNTGIIV